MPLSLKNLLLSTNEGALTDKNGKFTYTFEKINN